MYKVNGVSGNSLGPLGTTTLELPKKFQQQLIVYEHLFWPIILGLDVSYNYLIGIDWFSTWQLHLHLGPQSIEVSDLAPFPLCNNQIPTLPQLHLLVKTISQVTVISRTLAIVPTFFTSTPKPHCYYNLPDTSSVLEQNLFVIPLLKIFGVKLPMHLLCTIMNTGSNDIILPKNWHIGEMTPSVMPITLFTPIH